MEGDYDLAAGDELFEYFEEEEEGQDYDLAADELFPYEEEEGQVCHSYSCSHALSLSPTHHNPPHVTVPPSACLGSSADRLHTGGTALTVPR